MVLPQSKAAAFAHLRACGLQPSQDRFDRLRGNGFQTGFRLDAADRRREIIFEPELLELEFLLRLQRQLGPEKVRYRELAFWHRWNGYDAPPHLVREHIEHAFNALASKYFRLFYRLGSRQLIRISGSRLREACPRGIEKAARIFGRHVTQSGFGVRPKRATLGSNLSTVATAAAAIVLLSASRGRVDAVVRHRVECLLRGALPERSIAVVQRFLWLLLDDIVPVFLPHESNAYRSRLRSSNETDNSQLLRAIDGARVVVGYLHKATACFPTPWLNQPTDVETSIADGPELHSLSRDLIPISVAIVLTRWNDPLAARIERIRSGDVEELDQGLHKLLDLRNNIGALFNPIA